MNTIERNPQPINQYATHNRCCMPEYHNTNSHFTKNAVISNALQQMILQLISLLLSQLLNSSTTRSNTDNQPDATQNKQSTGSDKADNQEKPFRFIKNNGPDVNFPLTADKLESLKNTNAVSPTLKTDSRVVLDPNDFVPRPTNPSDEGFWDEFEQVVDMQITRRSGALAASEMDLPNIFSGMSMEEAAEAVHTDFPSKWPTELTKYLLADGAQMDSDIVPQRTEDDFVNRHVMLAELIGWAVSTVSPTTFAAKWEHGRARPETVAWAVHTGKLDAPQTIQDKIASMNLSSAEDFTAFPEGSPVHPSWPAMHSAASQASLFLAVVFDLTPEQLEETRKLDFAVAQFRSLAGVHYETDNLAGLTIGQEVIAQELPDFLAKFGADPDAVRAKIEQVRQDWYEYDYKKTS